MPLVNTYNLKLATSVWWNLFLLTVGSFILALSIQAVSAPHGFLAGGVVGTSLFMWYITDLFSVSVWYLILCIPIFIWGWFYVGRCFLLYTIYGSIATAVWGMLIKFEIPVKDELYAAVLAGVLFGTGVGIMLRSLGSAGGTDIIAVALKERWNISIGRFSFVYNICLFSLSAFFMSMDLILASTISMFISTTTIDHVITLFSQRKMVLIISEKGEAICEAILVTQKFGITLIRGKGGFSGRDREILLTVTNNVALKNLESIVFSVDENALFIAENTFYVSGGQFSRKLPIK